jgi:hypothetical protein
MQPSKNDRHFVLNPRNSRSERDDRRQDEDGCDESSAEPLSSDSMRMKYKVDPTTDGTPIQDVKKSPLEKIW